MTATPRADVQGLMQRLCVDEGGSRGLRCSTFYFVNGTIPGWQPFINSILQSYYGLPAQAYVDLVTFIGNSFVPQTYGDKLTPVYPQQARALTDQGVTVCYPVPESETGITLPAGCQAVAVLIPRPGARPVDGTSLFPRSEYMNQIFGQDGSTTTGIPEDIMRKALESALP